MEVTSRFPATSRISTDVMRTSTMGRTGSSSGGETTVYSAWPSPIIVGGWPARSARRRVEDADLAFGARSSTR